MDGYPDLLIPFMEATTGKTTIQLWQNVGCSDDLCGSDATSNGRRTFSQVTSGVDALTNLQNPYEATFFDIDEDVQVIDALKSCREW